MFSSCRKANDNEENYGNEIILVIKSRNNTRVFTNGLLDDLNDVLSGLSVLFHSVMAKGNVVGKGRLVPHLTHGI